MGPTGGTPLKTAIHMLGQEMGEATMEGDKRGKWRRGGRGWSPRPHVALWRAAARYAKATGEFSQSPRLEMAKCAQDSEPKELFN